MRGGCIHMGGVFPHVHEEVTGQPQMLFLCVPYPVF